MPGRKSHRKENSNRQKRSNNRGMMSGSSHAAERTLLEGLTKDKAVPATDIVAASVLLEPNCRDGGPRSRRNSSCTQTDEEGIRPVAAISVTPSPSVIGREDNSGGGDSDDRTDGAPRIAPAPKPDPRQEEEEDSCGVRCLYYTMQCCECSVM